MVILNMTKRMILRKIKTERLLLRPYRSKDVDGMVEALNDRAISKFILTISYPYRRKDALGFMQKAARDKVIAYGIFLPDGTLVGGCGISKHDRISRSAEIGYWCHRRHRNKGYVTEAALALLDYGFKNLRLNRIAIVCDVDNAASRKVIKKLGGVHEGIARQSVRIRGGFRDTALHSILREEYLMVK